MKYARLKGLIQCPLLPIGSFGKPSLLPDWGWGAAVTSHQSQVNLCHARCWAPRSGSTEVQTRVRKREQNSGISCVMKSGP